MDNPNYYAILPACVRYDKKISDGAKLLFAEITALSNKEGYCWATNEYFADVLGKHKNSISRLVSELSNAKHINLKMVNNENGTSRKIYPLNKIVNTPKQNCLDPLTKMSTPLNKNEYHNNISNIISNNKESISKNKFLPPTQKNQNSLLKKQEAPQKEKKVALKKEKEQLTQEEQELLKEANLSNEQPSVAEILRTPKPFDINEGVFHALRVFGAARQGKAKSNRMSAAAWQKMIRDCQKACATFEPVQLIELIETSKANGYKSPFFNNYQDFLNKQQANHATTNQPTSISNSATTGEKFNAALNEVFANKRFG